MAQKLFMMERRIPLALLFAFFVQIVGVIWWVSSTATHNQDMHTRVLQLEAAQAQENGQTREMLQRLARLEAYAEEHKAALRRIENALLRKTP